MIYVQSGGYFNYRDFKMSTIDINDIAHALGNICRFTGHTKKFYSVAEHSVHCSYLVPKDWELEALLHDAHEAYVGDVNSPLKSLLPDYKEVEDKVENQIVAVFGLKYDQFGAVKRSDMIMLRHEKTHALGCDHEWEITQSYPDVDLELQFWTPEVAKQKFLERFYEINS